jgi:hypothetical protein
MKQTSSLTTRLAESQESHTQSTSSHNRKAAEQLGLYAVTSILCVTKHSENAQAHADNAYSYARVAWRLALEVIR